MASGKKFLIIPVLMLLASPSWALYKCQDTSGKTSYQQDPCPTKAQQSQVEIADDRIGQKNRPYRPYRMPPPSVQQDLSLDDAYEIDKRKRLDSLAQSLSAKQKELAHVRTWCARQEGHTLAQHSRDPSPDWQERCVTRPMRLESDIQRLNAIRRQYD